MLEQRLLRYITVRRFLFLCSEQIDCTGRHPSSWRAVKAAVRAGKLILLTLYVSVEIATPWGQTNIFPHDPSMLQINNQLNHILENTALIWHYQHAVKNGLPKLSLLLQGVKTI